MKTTVEIQDDLLRDLKQYAARYGLPMRARHPVDDPRKARRLIALDTSILVHSVRETRRGTPRRWPRSGA